MMDKAIFNAYLDIVINTNWGELHGNHLSTLSLCGGGIDTSFAYFLVSLWRWFLERFMKGKEFFVLL